LECHAHNLKGSSANLGAASVAQAAGALEECAQSGNLERSSDLFKSMERELELLHSELEAFSQSVETGELKVTS
jgi:HPt (histidine-containing phosphotransfer) domain-containing protein